MNKSLKKYSSAKWINTRLSRPHKARQFFKRMQLSLIAQTQSSLIDVIANQAPPFNANGVERKEFYARKALAIAETYIDSFKAINKVAVK